MKVFSIRNFVIWCVAFVIGAVIVFGALNVHADGNNISVVITGNYSLGYQLRDDLSQEIKEYLGIVDEEYTTYDLARDFLSMYVGATTGLNTDLVNLMIETIGDYWVGLPTGTFYIDRETGLIHYPDGTYELIEQFYETHGMNQPTDASNFYYIYNSDNTTQNASYYFYVAPNYYGIRPFSATKSAYMAMYLDPNSSNQYYMVVCSLSDEPFSINVRRRRLAYSQSYLDSMSLGTFYNGTSTSGYYGVYRQSYSGAGGLDMSLCMFDSLESALSTFYGIGVIEDNTPTPNGDVYIIPESSLDEQQFNVFNLRDNDGLSRTVQRNTDINNGVESDENWLIVPEYNNIPYIADLNDIPNNHNFKYQYPIINDEEYTFEFDYDVDNDNSTIIKDVGDSLEPTGFLVSFFSVLGVFILLGVIL